MRRRHQLSINHVAAFAVEALAFSKIALCGSYHVAAKVAGRSRRFAAHHDVGGRDAKLEADQVIGLVRRRIAATGISFETVLGKTLADVVRRRLEGDIDAPTQI